MEKFTFSQNESLSEWASVLLKRFENIGNRMKSISEDTGFKDGSFSTEYEYKLNGIVFRVCETDAETSKSLHINGELVAMYHNCWGRGFFELKSTSSLDLDSDKLISKCAT